MIKFKNSLAIKVISVLISIVFLCPNLAYSWSSYKLRPAMVGSTFIETHQEEEKETKITRRDFLRRSVLSGAISLVKRDLGSLAKLVTSFSGSGEVVGEVAGLIQENKRLYERWLILAQELENLFDRGVDIGDQEAREIVDEIPGILSQMYNPLQHYEREWNSAKEERLHSIVRSMDENRNLSPALQKELDSLSSPKRKLPDELWKPTIDIFVHFHKYLQELRDLAPSDIDDYFNEGVAAYFEKSERSHLAKYVRDTVSYYNTIASVKDSQEETTAKQNETRKVKDDKEDPYKKKRGERKLGDIAKEWRRVKKLLEKHNCTLEIVLCNMWHGVEEERKVFPISAVFLERLYSDFTLCSFELPPSAVKMFIKGVEQSQMDLSIVAQRNRFWRDILMFSQEKSLELYGVDAAAEIRYAMHRTLRELKKDFFVDDKEKILIRLDDSKVGLRDIGYDSDDILQQEKLIEFLNLDKDEQEQFRKYKIVWLEPQEDNFYRPKPIVLYYCPHASVLEMIRKIKEQYNPEIDELTNGSGNIEELILYYIEDFFVTLRDVAQARWMGEYTYRFLRDADDATLPEELRLIHFGGAAHYKSLRFLIEQYGEIEVPRAISDPRTRIPNYDIEGSIVLANEIADILNNTDIDNNEFIINNTDYFVWLFGKYLEEKKVGLLRRTALHEKTENHYIEAQKLLEKAVAIDPNDPYSWVDLAQCYLFTRDETADFPFEKIRQHLNRALEIDPNNFPALYEMLWWCLAKGENDDGFYYKIIDNDTLTFEEWIMVGDFYMKERLNTPNLFRAIDVYRKVLQDDPEHPIAKEKLDKIFSDNPDLSSKRITAMKKIKEDI